MPRLPESTRDAVKQAIDIVSLAGEYGLQLHRSGSKFKALCPFHDDHNPSLILEKLVPFQREISVLGVRGKDGQTEFYPLIENRHRDGILRLSLAPVYTPVATSRAIAW